MTFDDTTTERCFSATQVGQGGKTSRFALHNLAFRAAAGADAGTTYEIVAPHATIGTASTNDVVVRDDTVSRHHCEVVMRDERFVIRDLGSTNGTYVDNVRVIEACLARGSRIRLGETELVFDPTTRWLPVDDSELDHFGDLWGSSAIMRRVFSVLERVAPTMLTCLVTGETGTGKDLAARAIHAASPRADAPFVVVDCGAVHRNLIESELFGHEKGAFTGADRRRTGSFERASGGTVFLDEIGELPLDLQSRLLRVLERREVTRLGAEGPIDVDVRVIAATHRDLASMVREETFREDLFYRLAEVIIELPPLRERREDIALIAERLIAGSPPAGAARRPSIAPDALEYLARRDWPGNVRELRNVMRRGVALAAEDGLSARLLRELDSSGGRGAPPAKGRATDDEVTLSLSGDLPIREAREAWAAAIERAYLERLVERFGGDLDQAAVHARVHRKSLVRLLRQHGLRKNDG